MGFSQHGFGSGSVRTSTPGTSWTSRIRIRQYLQVYGSFYLLLKV
jgi:hypothetical protein